MERCWFIGKMVGDEGKGLGVREVGDLCTMLKFFRKFLDKLCFVLVYLGDTTSGTCTKVFNI